MAPYCKIAMLDFTKNIKLEGKYLHVYNRIRIALFALFLFCGALVAWKILFPSQSFAFFFRSAGALKNTLVSPRDAQNKLIPDGKISTASGLKFDAPLPGNYSKVSVTFILENDSAPLEKGTLTARKSYQAFFYPEGAPLETKSAELFKIGDDYYQLKNQQLFRFVSEKAYLTNYAADQAVEKTGDFLKVYPLSEELLGFADGTLISTKESVFIVSGASILPIADVETFESMNYIWGDVLPVSGEEKGIYKRTKLFTLSSPHPNGTIFLEKDTGKYFYIQNGQRHPVATPEILAGYLKNSPIVAENKSFTTESRCVLQKRILAGRKYACEFDLAEIKNNLGNDYQFTLKSTNDVAIQEINIEFKREFSAGNFHLALSELKKRLLQNYAPQ